MNLVQCSVVVVDPPSNSFSLTHGVLCVCLCVCCVLCLPPTSPIVVVCSLRFLLVGHCEPSHDINDAGTVYIPGAIGARDMNDADEVYTPAHSGAGT